MRQQNLYQRELQVIDSEQKAYLLGLFFSDGNISMNQHHSRLFLKDQELIRQLQTIFPFFNLHEDNRNDKAQLGLHSGIGLVRQDFISNGCLPNKSFSNKDIIKLPNIDSILLSHFVRGYFDGNGGCTLNNELVKTQKRVYIYSASLGLLEDFKILLNASGINSTITSSHIFKLTVSTESYKQFYTYLYTDCSIYLERKKALFSNIIENTNFFIQKIAPTCKFCSSYNTVFNGNYTYKNISIPRVLCKDCNRNFTITAPNSSNIISGEDELLER